MRLAELNGVWYVVGLVDWRLHNSVRNFGDMAVSVATVITAVRVSAQIAAIATEIAVAAGQRTGAQC